MDTEDAFKKINIPQKPFEDPYETMNKSHKMESKTDIEVISIEPSEDEDIKKTTVKEEKQNLNTLDTTDFIINKVNTDDSSTIATAIETINTNTTVSTPIIDSDKQIIKLEKEEDKLENSTENIPLSEVNLEGAQQDSVIEKTDNYVTGKRKSISNRRSVSPSTENGVRSKRKKIKNISDKFCWRCHKESADIHCTACPRSWHRRCIGGPLPNSIQSWICGECAMILKAENAETRSVAMAQLSIDQLCMLLKHVIQRMRDYPGSEPFWKPVEISEAPNYLDYIVKPMDLSLLESNVRAKLYGSTDAFMSDAKWIQHNCIVFNTCGGVYADVSKLTNAAKQIIKLARQEVSEIEACPDCYAHGRNLPRPQPHWFIEPCRQPHPLVWAKLKGFPFWPAKAMPRINSQGFVDVRFFGEHDRAWVSPKDLYLYSEDPPVPLPRKKKMDMDECVREITRHCRKLELTFGKFSFAPPKVQYNPHDPMQIKLMLPNYDPLQANNCSSPQVITPKKKVPLRKRGLPNKEKGHNDALTTDVTDDVSDSNVLPSIEESTDERKIQKSPMSDQSKSSSNSQNDVNIDVASNKLQESVIKTEKESMEEDSAPLEVGKSTKSNEKNDDKHDNEVEGNKLTELNLSISTSNSQQTHNNVISADRVVKQQKTFGTTENLKTDLTLRKSSLVKNINNKNNINNNATDLLKVALKSVRNTGKVYKPKARLVDKLNAEKALKSLSEIENKDKDMQMIITTISSSIQNEKSDATFTSSLSSTHTTTSQSNVISSGQKSTVTVSSTTNSTIDQTGIVTRNSGSTEATEQCTSTADSPKNKDISVITKSKPKEQKKESKARKSFPAKPTYSQIAFRSTSNTLPSTNESTILVSSPTQQKENSLGYQLIPPEAGPLSAHLYYSAEELTKRMAQLMEEAFREAVQNEQNSEDETSDKHRATVHFLRLQIERMRWQHQQQIAELKHNTDRVLREMKASLEIERLRAIEETRRELEEEKKRCVEETKRKQWCAMCHREALFYCCWNTAYCDYACQQSHWPTHMKTCAQKPSFTTIVTTSNAGSNQQHVSNNITNPACKVYTLPHDKSTTLSSSCYVSCSKDEDKTDQS